VRDLHDALGQQAQQDRGVTVAWEAVIGLEVHAQLLTKSKMFCACSAQYADTEPNSHVCQVCSGMPGVLPVMNREAVRFTVMTGLALHCTIPAFSKFDRKNYFYPDLPKGYQISQYDLPLAVNGFVNIEGVDGPKRIGITRVHLEEDTGKSTHPGGGFSLVDFNRCGIPLMEIVSEPDLRTAEEARQYFMQLRNMLLYLGISNGDMSKGCLRCDANVSVRPVGTTEYGTKTEIKNMNSFRSVKLAIEYEIARQIATLEAGGRVVQETRGWIEDSRETVSQRSKEYAEDYRYFPEPDLPPLLLDRAWIDDIRLQLPEMADARAERYSRDFGLSPGDAGQLTASRALADLFERTTVQVPHSARAVANWLLNEFKRLLAEAALEVDEQSTVQPTGLAALIRLVEGGQVNSTAAKRVFEIYFQTGEAPESIVQRLGLHQVSDRGRLEPVARAAIAANPRAVTDFRRGKEVALKAVVGTVMKEMKGAANARVVEDLLRELIAQG
jgi:aspartyl-tRNA(Asn)/glutamyl-tRNA(Gln) amidotransferase subunit B